MLLFSYLEFNTRSVPDESEWAKFTSGHANGETSARFVPPASTKPEIKRGKFGAKNHGAKRAHQPSSTAVDFRQQRLHQFGSVIAAIRKNLQCWAAAAAVANKQTAKELGFCCIITVITILQESPRTFQRQSTNETKVASDISVFFTFEAFKLGTLSMDYCFLMLAFCFVNEFLWFPPIFRLAVVLFWSWWNKKFLCAKRNNKIIAKQQNEINFHENIV